MRVNAPGSGDEYGEPPCGQLNNVPPPLWTGIQSASPMDGHSAGTY